MPSPSDNQVGRVVRAPSLGRGWLAATRAVLEEGRKAEYDGAPIVELGLLDLVVDDPSDIDGLIERFGDGERISWMHANFTDFDRVGELGGSASYATRQYDYESSGRDQLAWATESCVRTVALARQSSRLFSRFLTPRTFLVSAFSTSGSLTGPWS